MDLNPEKKSMVLTDPTPINKSKVRARSSVSSNSNPYLQCGERLSSSVGSIPHKKLDDIRSDDWLDAMKSSAPDERKVVKDHGVELVSSENDFAYQSWMVKYPSALQCFEKIMNFAKEKKIVMFLDYDGTLSPIVDDPDRAFMSPDMRSAVKSVAKYFPTAIISGRSRDKVYELVGLTELYYAGSHGMDIMFPVRETVSTDHSNCIKSTNSQGEEVNLFQPAMEFLPMIDEVFRTLVENTKNINGIKVENHRFCASVHYRNVDEKSWPMVAQCVHDTLKDYPRLRLTHGRKVLEVRPVIDWDKGKAVEFLLKSLRIDNSDDVLPIYIGDDRTDEDAFKVLREGNRGYGILVSSSTKESKAIFSLRDPSEVNEFLKSLVRWKEQDAPKVPKEEHKDSCTLYRYSVILGVVIAIVLVVKRFY